MSLRYVSTSGRAPAVSLEQAVFRGPAPDGGLYVPETLERIDPSRLRSLSAASPVESVRLAGPGLFGDALSEDELDGLARAALDFPIPLLSLGEASERLFVLELFHGPTLAFKDVGARFMARLVGHFARRGGRESTVLVATSGDTGSAVAHAFFREEGIRVVVLYPRGKVSELQQKLFTTLGGNVSAVSIAGSFDDCQSLVKRAFADPVLSERRALLSANSINLARLLPQSFYYFHLFAQLEERDRPLRIAVPSGNFGNLTAGLIAKKLGLPCERFVAATNANDVVPEYLRTGVFAPRPSVGTLTNAMDVGNPSNFARIEWLYQGAIDLLREDLVGSSHTDEETMGAMKRVYEQTGYLLDPHSAIGYLGAERLRSKGGNTVFLATAHPAKFEDRVERATGASIQLPEALTRSLAATEQIDELPADFDALKDYLEGLDRG